MRLPVRIALVVGLGLAGVTGAEAQISTVDPAGQNPSMAIGADGLALISYRDAYGFRVAHCDNLVCSRSTVTSHPGASRGGYGTSLAIGVDGLGLIAYDDQTMLDPSELRVAHCNDPDCSGLSVSTIDSGGVGEHASLAIGADGLGLISYYDQDGYDLKVAHCNDVVCSSATITELDTVGTVGFFTSVTSGMDGLGLISYQELDGPEIRVAHCHDLACSSADISRIDGGSFGGAFTSIAIGSDGLALVSYVEGFNLLKVAHCEDFACSSATVSTIHQGSADTSIAIGADGLGLVSYDDLNRDEILVAHCDDVVCSSATVSTIDGIGMGGSPRSVAIGPDGLPLVAYSPFLGGISVAHCSDALCSSTLPLQADLSVTKANGVPAVLAGQGVTWAVEVSNSGPAPVIWVQVTDTLPAPVLAASWTCVASAGSSCGASEGSGSIDEEVDLLVGGTATFTLTGTVASAATGSLSNTASVQAPDGIEDPTAGNNTATDTDPILAPVFLAIDDVSRMEGDSGASDATFAVTLSPASSGTVTVDYATVAGSATPGVDYTATSGTLTFSPGETSQPIEVPIVGDTAAEPDETYYVDLHAPANALVAGGLGVGTILDDDGGGGAGIGLPVELVSGGEEVRSLAALPGPRAAEHLYLLRQKPYASYELVVDQISGDVQPLEVDRLAADWVTTLQSARKVSAVGASLSLRWENPTPSATENEVLRIRSGVCTIDCGADDTYRVRFYETTGAIQRFNNAGTQVTVLILQNPTDDGVAGTIRYWSAGGSLLASSEFDLPAKGTLVLDTASVPGLSGQSGSMTVAHDGRYGALSGKAVALEPATGFSFDSPMEMRPH